MLNNYVISKYNLFFEYRNAWYVYNSLVGSLAEIEQEIKILLESNNIDKLYKNKIFPDLLSNGFIVSADTQEFDVLLNRFEEDRNKIDTLYLTIVLTMNCNLRCVYCYQNNSATHRISTRSISNDFIKVLVKFIERYQKLSRLEITWFGGEPLLEIVKLNNFSKVLVEYCSDNHIEYSASIITNGYLLSTSNVKMLIDSKVKSMQLTLDGPKAIHDSRRIHMLKGYSSYDKILTFLHSEYASHFDISLRLNIDKNNISDIPDLLKELMPIYSSNISIDFAPVESYNDYCNNENEVFSTEEFAKIMIDMTRMLIDLGMIKDAMAVYPNPTFSYCGATRKSSFMIMFNGDLYKCWCDLENVEKRNGSVFTNTSNYNFYIDKNPLADNTCIECKILPLCMGGCLYKKSISKQECPTIRYNLFENLKLYLDLINKER